MLCYASRFGCVCLTEFEDAVVILSSYLFLGGHAIILTAAMCSGVQVCLMKTSGVI